jgi:hypothetical protein
MYSIGLDISKSSIAVHIPKNSLDLEIENSAKALKSLYAKLKKIYKKEFKKLYGSLNPPEATHHCSTASVLIKRFLSLCQIPNKLEALPKP